MHFTKMHGAGNDFIVLDTIAEPLDAAEDVRPAFLARLCDRHTGVGADGVMLLERPAGDADVAMRFFNSDGSMGEMCGNGARCICRYAHERGYAGSTIRVETTAGLVTGRRITKDQYRIRLNTPSVVHLQQTLRVDGTPYICSYVELGSPGIPHLAVPVRDLAGQDEDALRRLGRALRYHPSLPKGANVNFYELTGPDTVLEKTYERGVEDFTLACGTGCGTAAAALTLRGLASGRGVRFLMPGGELSISLTVENGAARDIYLTGPTAVVYEAELAEP